VNIALASPERTLTIAVTTNFETTFKQLQPLFEQQYKIKLNPAFASTGKLYTQIVHGAPFDVFLSGDKEHVTLLEKEGFSSPTQYFIYAIGELVIYAPGKNIKKNGLAELISLHTRKIAIANPNTAPYGLAAMQVLQHDKLWTVLKNKFVLGEDTGQVATFLITHNVDLGFLANSQLIDIIRHSRHPIDSQEVWKVPVSMYAPLNQYATLIVASHTPQDAKIFLNFLQSKAAKKIISENGYHF